MLGLGGGGELRLFRQLLPVSFERLSGEAANEGFIFLRADSPCTLWSPSGGGMRREEGGGGGEDRGREGRKSHDGGRKENRNHGARDVSED